VAPSWGLPAGAVVSYNSDKVASDSDSATGVNENLSSSTPTPTHTSRPSRKKKTRSGERCGADIEKKRLKKNAREQRRATKINDQINILKNILEVSDDDDGKTTRRAWHTYTPLLTTKEINVFNTLVNNGLIDQPNSSCHVVWFVNHQNTGMQVMNTKSSILSDTISLLQTMLKGQPHVPLPQAYAPADQMLLEPYYMLFRKSATPLAIAKADSTGQFLDW